MDAAEMQQAVDALNKAVKAQDEKPPVPKGLNIAGMKWLQGLLGESSTTIRPPKRGKLSFRKTRRQQRTLANAAMAVHKVQLATEKPRRLQAVKLARVLRNQQIQMRRHIKKYGTATEMYERLKNPDIHGIRPVIEAESA